MKIYKLFLVLCCFFLKFTTHNLWGQAGPPVFITNNISVIYPELNDFKLIYRREPLPVLNGQYRENWLINLQSTIGDDLMFDISSFIQTNRSSSSVAPLSLREGPMMPIPWGYRIPIFGQSGDHRDFGGVIADGQALVFGFRLRQMSGLHFGWARLQGTNGSSRNANLYDNFDPNKPPVLSEVTINPVPYAAIQLGRPSPGGPKLTFTRQPPDKLRLSYPDWGTRYVVRRRSLPKGLVTKVYPGGRNGLVATNGVYSVDVSLEDAQGFFELYLPPENVAP